MKLTFVLLLAVLFLTAPLSAQVLHPMKVEKARYFDKTPPLREMKIVMPGERKRAWKDGIIENESVDWNAIGGGTHIPGDYDRVQEEKGTTGSRGPLQNFDGVGNVNGVYPPDTDGDVGPNHYFQMINLSFAIWDKNGNRLYGPVDNSTLWAGFIGPWTGHNDGDPIVLYDEMADRWMASQFALNTSSGKFYQLVAVSVTGDPLGDYYRYAFEFDHMNDYPKMSVWPDGYYATFNFFGQQFMGSGVAAFEREKMLAGDPDAQMVFFGYFQSKFSLQPSDLDGEMPPPAGSPCFIACANTTGSKQFEIYEMNVDWETPSNSTYQLYTSINPGYYNSEVDGIPQPNTSTRLDDLSQMLMFRLAYRNFISHEVMVANHTVNVNGRAGIKWYEFRKTGNEDWAIYQQGVYAPNDGLHRWMGSIAMSATGTIALGFSVANGTDKHASIRYTGRPASAPLGEMIYEEIEVTTGSGSQSGISRWGDYSCLSVDPADDTTFWFTTEYMRGGWKTRVASFNFAPIQPPVVNAGDDATVCQNTLFTTAGTVVSAKTWQWSTSGDGIFATPYNLITYYLPGPQDATNGEATLTLSAEGYLPGMNAFDNMVLTVNKWPVVFAGNDTTINSYTTYPVNGTGQNYSSVAWSTNGDGQFENNNTLQTIYTPGQGDIDAGEVKLTLSAAPIDPCTATDADEVKVYLEPLMGIHSVTGNAILSVNPNPSGGEFTVKIGNLSSDIILKVANTAGEVLFTEKINRQRDAYTKTFDFRFLPKGFYMVQVESATGTVTEKVVIQ